MMNIDMEAKLKAKALQEPTAQFTEEERRLKQKARKVYAKIQTILKK